MIINQHQSCQFNLDIDCFVHRCERFCIVHPTFPSTTFVAFMWMCALAYFHIFRLFTFTFRTCTHIQSNCFEIKQSRQWSVLLKSPTQNQCLFIRPPGNSMICSIHFYDIGLLRTAYKMLCATRFFNICTQNKLIDSCLLFGLIVLRTFQTYLYLFSQMILLQYFKWHHKF